MFILRDLKDIRSSKKLVEKSLFFISRIGIIISSHAKLDLFKKRSRSSSFSHIFNFDF